MKTTRSMLMACLLAPVPVLAQTAGHSSLPTTGPAARERSSARPAEDDLQVQVERLRRDLSDLARRYRKVQGEERAALAQRAMPLLERMASELKDLSAAAPAPPKD
jgi:hypothetical protein